MMFRICLVMVALVMAVAGHGAEEEMPSNVPTLAPEELENYQFDTKDEQPPVVNELSVAQRAVLDAQRRQIKDVFATRLGVLKFDGDKRDLRHIQRLVDKGILKNTETLEWQKVGVLFGDILVEEFDLEWVSYEDERGKSKALQWRDSMNFVFPVTVFSRRAQYNEKIDVKAIYDKIASDIENFSEGYQPPRQRR